jgi:succinate-acetate transporter protein
MDERTITRPGLETPAESSAWAVLQDRVSITLRPIGGPLSIGLYGLSAATLVLAGLQLGWISPQEGKNVALALIGFAFVSQLLAAVLSFLGRDGAVATAMTVLALTWLVIGLVLHRSAPGATSDALGLFLLFTGTAMILAAITAGTSKLITAAVFALAAVRFLVAAGYELSGSQGWERTSGVLGLVLFVLAMYAAFAVGLEDAMGRTVLPLGRRSQGKVAMHGSLLEQVSQVPNQPGVRTRL